MIRFGIRPADFFFLLLAVFLCTFSIASLKRNKKNAPVVSVTAKGQEYLFSLEKDGTYTVEGTLGTSTIVVQDATVRFEDSPCPNKIGVQSRPISQTGEWIACLPNDVFITITGGQNELDALAF